MFIDPNTKIPVTLDGNTIYIKAKMDMGTIAAVQDSVRARGVNTLEDFELQGLGTYRTALLIHNIVGWEGPAFVDSSGRPIPCIPANILRLDPQDPLVDLVAEEIGVRNQAKTAPDPNAVTPTG
jgi:hypothetical protein